MVIEPQKEIGKSEALFTRKIPYEFLIHSDTILL